MKLLFALFTILILSNLHGQNLTPSEKKNLIGSWISLEDSSSRIVISKTKKTDWYENEKTSVYTYHLSKDSLIAEDQTDHSIFNYSILSITKTNLTLLYLGRGNLLLFRRQQSRKN